MKSKKWRDIPLGRIGGCHLTTGVTALVQVAHGGIDDYTQWMNTWKRQKGHHS